MIPLSKIDQNLFGERDFNPIAFYNNKATCVETYNKLITTDGVSKKVKGDIRELTNPEVMSALDLMKDMPRLVDLIYSLFPDAYNEISPGFGRIDSVRFFVNSKGKRENKKHLRIRPKTKYYQNDVTFSYPDGFIAPLIWALSELIDNKDGILSWKVNPDHFLKSKMSTILKTYQGMIVGSGWDPQKVGKNGSWYELAKNEFKTRLVLDK